MRLKKPASALAAALLFALAGCGSEEEEGGEPESQLTAAQAEEIATAYVELDEDCPSLVDDEDLCGGFGTAGLPEEIADVSRSEVDGEEALVWVEPTDDSGEIVVTLVAEGEEWKVSTWGPAEVFESS